MKAILIIDDESVTRISLASLLHQQFADTQIHAIANTDITLFLHNHPDLSLIICDFPSDERQPTFLQFESLQALVPNSPILLNSRYKHSEFDLLGCFAAGVRGFLPKTAPLREYLTAISTIMEGRSYLGMDAKLAMIKALRECKLVQAQTDTP